MRPFTYTTYDLFEKDRRHLVPLFQRPYVWTLDGQWQPLWNDISTKADLLLETGETDPDSMHFMGAAVLSEVKVFGRATKIMAVIDGQQRLTTLQVILLALRDFVRLNNHDARLLTKLEKLTKNDWREDEIEMFKVWPTNADRTVFSNLVRANSITQIEQLYPRQRVSGSRTKWIQRPALVEAYLFFYNKINAYSNNIEEYEAQNDAEILGEFSPDRLEAIYQTVVDHFQMVVIELEESDNPQIIFETLNARGVPLHPSDLIRNFVFLEAAKNKEDIDRLYEVYWSSFDEPADGASFWKQEEQQGRLRRPRLDLLIFHYLVYKTQREIVITSLFQEFSKWWRNIPKANAEVQLKDLQHFANVFHSFYETKNPSRIGIFVRRLRDLDTSTVFPLLLFIFGERGKEISSLELDGIVADLESYLVRRIICGLSAKNYNRFFLNLLQNLSKKDENGDPIPVTRAAIQKLLLQSTAPTSRWPNDEEFKRAWLTKPMYATNRPRTRMVLEALDLQLMTSKQERVHIDDTPSIEHIYPQSPDPHEWADLSQIDINRFYRLIHGIPLDDLIHTFGNLTLVTQPLNASISNGAFDEKAVEIAKQSILRLNVYFQGVQIGNTWGPSEIETRGETMFEIAQRIWSYPSLNIK